MKIIVNPRNYNGFKKRLHVLNVSHKQSAKKLLLVTFLLNLDLIFLRTQKDCLENEQICNIFKCNMNLTVLLPDLQSTEGCTGVQFLTD